MASADLAATKALGVARGARAAAILALVIAAVALARSFGWLLRPRRPSLGRWPSLPAPTYDDVYAPRPSLPYRSREQIPRITELMVRPDLRGEEER